MLLRFHWRQYEQSDSRKRKRTVQLDCSTWTSAQRTRWNCRRAGPHRSAEPEESAERALSADTSDRLKNRNYSIECAKALLTHATSLLHPSFYSFHFHKFPTAARKRLIDDECSNVRAGGMAAGEVGMHASIVCMKKEKSSKEKTIFDINEIL